MISQLEAFYGPAWFALGDRDLATHIYRTDRLRHGARLSECTREIAAALGVRVRVLPATDDRLRTTLETDEGTLAFQTYLVKRRGRPLVRSVDYDGAATAKPAPGVLDAIAAADAVLIAPSNPFVSIGPMLAMPELRQAVANRCDRAVAVSPLIGGAAVKGPLAAMLQAMGRSVDVGEIAAIYRGLVATLVVARGDLVAGAVDPAATSRRPRMVEHDILLDGVAAARKLSAFMIALAAGPAGGQARSRA